MRRQVESAHYGSKFLLLERMLVRLQQDGEEKIVIVSNYTETLDLVMRMCRTLGIGHVRLDGRVAPTKRQAMVDRFNDPSTPITAFLLSSLAGGCGINLIGASRLVLFDPAWNPAHDKQAAARIWREGQAKPCYIYRFMTAGTIEEKIYQRQLSKEGLQSVVLQDEETLVAKASRDELRNIFTFKDVDSETHDLFDCEKCKKLAKLRVLHPRTGFYRPAGNVCDERDASTWDHLPNPCEANGLTDTLLKECGKDIVSFVFRYQTTMNQGEKPSP